MTQGRNNDVVDGVHDSVGNYYSLFIWIIKLFVAILKQLAQIFNGARNIARHNRVAAPRVTSITAVGILSLGNRSCPPCTTCSPGRRPKWWTRTNLACSLPDRPRSRSAPTILVSSESSRQIRHSWNKAQNVLPRRIQPTVSTGVSRAKTLTSWKYDS